MIWPPNLAIGSQVSAEIWLSDLAQVPQERQKGRGVGSVRQISAETCDQIARFCGQIITFLGDPIWGVEMGALLRGKAKFIGPGCDITYEVPKKWHSP